MNKDLNTLLKDWQSRKQADGEHIDRAVRSVMEQVSSDRFPGAWENSAGESPVSFWRKSLYAGIGAVCVLLFGAVLFFYHGTPADGVSRFAEIRPEERRENSVIFREVERLFDERLQWIFMNRGELSLGIDPDGGYAVSSGQPVLVRMVVVKRSNSESAWATVWKNDLVMRSEELVQVSVDDLLPERLAFWILPNEDGTFSVDSRWSLMDLPAISASSFHILAPGRPKNVLTTKSDDTEYRIYQTVITLEPEASEQG